jgi:pimeloyl-ACP methyl ester carboxylesterase
MECVLEDITINYQMVGSGMPLLFLHGSIGDHQLWFQTMELLFDRHSGWERLYVDLPGHGRTHAPEWLVNDDQVLEVLLRFIDRVIPDRRLVVAGFSWGGYLAQGILYHLFSDVEGLLLIAPVMHRDNEKKPERTILLKDETLLMGLDEMARGVATGLLVMQNPGTIARLQALSQSFQSFLQDDPDFAAESSGAFRLT